MTRAYTVSKIRGLPPVAHEWRSATIKVSGAELQTTPVFDAYWRFACLRQRVFFDRHFPQNRRTSAQSDPVLQTYRFTNAYRASDRVSQYLIKEVVKDGYSEESLFLRILLFKIFNKIETWEAISTELGEMSTDTFNIGEIDSFLSHRQDIGLRNYSAAYIMPSAGKRFECQRKHSSHLRLINWMLEDHFPDQLQKCESMKDAYNLLISAPSIGPFLAYQFVTDLNYSSLTEFSEMDFVKAGPGALDGISKCFTGADLPPPDDLISYMAETQQDHFHRLGLDFPSLWGRQLQLIDCQNLFCEISKYSRVAYPEVIGVAGRTRIKQNYSPSSRPVEQLRYPKSWGIDTSTPPKRLLLNSLAAEDLGGDQSQYERQIELI